MAAEEAFGEEIAGLAEDWIDDFSEETPAEDI